VFISEKVSGPYDISGGKISYGLEEDGKYFKKGSQHRGKHKANDGRGTPKPWGIEIKL